MFSEVFVLIEIQDYMAHISYGPKATSGDTSRRKKYFCVFSIKQMIILEYYY